MTAQMSEKLIYQSETLALCSQPLAYFLEMAAIPWKFKAPHTALWRGYVGTWRIEADRLYLVGLSGWTSETERAPSKQVGLGDLFPGYPDGVFAHWFTGELRCPRGGLLEYVRGGFSSGYEEDLFLQVRRGVLLGERVVQNGTAAPGAPKGYAIAAWTTLGKGGRNDR